MIKVVYLDTKTDPAWSQRLKIWVRSSLTVIFTAYLVGKTDPAWSGGWLDLGKIKLVSEDQLDAYEDGQDIYSFFDAFEMRKAHLS